MNDIASKCEKYRNLFLFIFMNTLFERILFIENISVLPL